MCGTCAHMYAGTYGSQEVSGVLLKPEAHYLPRLASKLSGSVCFWPSTLGLQVSTAGVSFYAGGRGQNLGPAVFTTSSLPHKATSQPCLYNS